MTRSTAHSRVIALTLALGLLLAACSSSTNAATSASSPAAGSTAPTTSSTSRTLADYYAGTDRALPTSGPKAAVGKNVWVLSCSAAAPGCATPAAGVFAAGQAIGWRMNLVDGKLDPSRESGLIRDAISAHADAIVLVAVDCESVVASLQAAKAAGVKVLGIYAFDCNTLGSHGAPLFSGEVNFGPEKDFPTYMNEELPNSIVDYVKAATNGKGEIIEFRQDDLNASKDVARGLDREFKTCSGCTVHIVEFTISELLNGTLQQKAAAALAQYPGATAVVTPYDSTILLGVGAAVTQARASGRKLILTGSEGLAPNLTLIAKGQQQYATGVPAEWMGWAAIDSVNRLFANAPLVDEGIGSKAIDAQHPPTCRPFVNGACVDFKSAYKRLWGVN